MPDEESTSEPKGAIDAEIEEFITGRGADHAPDGGDTPSGDDSGAGEKTDGNTEVEPDPDDGPGVDDNDDDDDDVESDDDDDDPQLKEDKPSSKEGFDKEFKALTAKRKKVRLGTEERAELVEFKKSEPQIRQYVSEVETWGKGQQTRAEKAEASMAQVQTSPMKALEAGGWTLEDVAALVIDPQAQTETMKQRADARVTQQRTAEQQEIARLRQENYQNRRATVGANVHQRVETDLQVAADNYPAIAAWHRMNPGEVTRGITQAIMNEHEKTGNLLDHNALFEQAEIRLKPKLEALGFKLSADPPQTRGPKTSGLPRHEQAAEPQRPAVIDDHADPVSLEDEMDTFLQSRSG